MGEDEITSSDLLEAIGLSGVSPELVSMSEQITSDFLAEPGGAESQPTEPEVSQGQDTENLRHGLTNATPADQSTGFLPQLITAGKGIVGSVGTFANKNPELTKIIASGIGGAVSSSNAKSAAATIAQGRIDELRLAAQLKQDQANTNSANVLAMRKPGIIGAQSQLQRTNGSNVFDNGKYIKA